MDIELESILTRAIRPLVIGLLRDFMGRVSDNENDYYIRIFPYPAHGSLLHKVENPNAPEEIQLQGRFYHDFVGKLKDNKRFSRAGKNGILLSDELQDPGFKPLKMKKIEFEMQFWLNIEEMLSCYKNDRDRHWSLSSLLEEYRFRIAESLFQNGEGENSESSVTKKKQRSITGNIFSLLDNNESREKRKIELLENDVIGMEYDVKNLKESLLQEPQTDLPRAFEEYSRNHFTALPGSRLLASSVKKEKPMYTIGNRFSQLVNNESWIVLDIGLVEALDWRRGKMTSELHLSDRNMPIDSEFQHGYTFNQHKRKKIAQRVSSFVVSTIAFLGIFFDIWSQLSIIQVQPLHKKHGPLSIWLPFLGLLGFMVFVCAVATMILVRAPFTRMQKAMLIFWGILMHLQSAKSISTAMFVPLVGVVFMGSHMLLEKTITK